MPIKQDRSCDESVKTEYDESQGIALAEFNEEAVDVSLPALLRMAAKQSAAIFVETSGERFRKTGRNETSRRANGERQDCRSKGSRGRQSPLAELRGVSFFSGCRGEASLHSGSRVQPRPVKVMRIVTLYWVLPAVPKE